MPNPFRRTPNEGPPHGALDAPDARDDQPQRRPGPNWGVYSDYVPQSARPPEFQRLAPFNFDEEPGDGPDEDIEFLTSLARQVDGPPAGARSERRAPRVTPPPAQNVYEPIVPAERDAMQAFHDYAARGADHTPTPATLRVDSVEIGDLVEDLADTIAALRRRRAA